MSVRRWKLRLVLLAALAAVVSTLAPSAASAGARLIESAPAPGASRAIAPPSIRLTFDSPVEMTELTLFDGWGERVFEATPPSEPIEQFTAPLGDALASGHYLASWAAVAEDGEPLGASFAFAIGAGPGGASGAEPASGAFWLGVAGRTVFLALASTAIGIALFSGLFLGAAPSPGGFLGRLGATSAIALPALGLAAVSLAGLAANAGDGADFFSADSLARGFATPLGFAVAWVTIGASSIALGALFGRLLGRLLAAIGAAIALYALTLAAPASSAAPSWLTAPALIAHLAIGCFWIGGLWVIAHSAPRLEPESGARFLQRFSAISQPAVVVTILLGFAIAAIQLGDVDALFASHYGNALLFKIALVGATTLIALANKAWLTRLWRRSSGGAARLTRWSAGAQLALLAGVLASTAALSQLGAPAQGHAFKARTVHWSLTTSDGHALWLSAERAGPRLAGLEARIVSPSDAALVPSEATIALARPEHGVQPWRSSLERAGDDRLRASGSTVVFPGPWRVTIEGRDEGGGALRLETELRVAAP